MPAMITPSPFPPGVDPRRIALFLDFDGTLVEIAPTPDTVVVPPGLPALLERLGTRLGGALAIVSGRPLRELDHFLPSRLAMAAEHGAALRIEPGAEAERPNLPSPPEEWRQRALALAESFAGARLENKAHGLVVHWRLAPEAAEPARALLEGLVAEQPDHFTLLPAHMAWEVKPRSVSKGTVVARFLAHPPFAGRVPVFIGDDVTDEAGMAAAQAAGGLGLKLQDAFGSPARLREWLASLEAEIAAQERA